MRRILVADSDRDGADGLSKILPPESYSLQISTDAEAAMHRLKAWKPHMILLDLRLPGLSPAEFVARARQVSADDYVPILITASSVPPEELARALEAGADDYLSKPYVSIEVSARIKSILRIRELHDTLRRANQRIEELSFNDDLTGLMNIRALYKRGDDEIMRARRFRKPISALLINLDSFSTVNQVHGFDFGSDMLRNTGRIVKGCLRTVDLVARVGADEFFALLVETDLAGAEFVAERIRDAIHSHEFRSDRAIAQVTASIGVAGITPDQGEHRMSELLHFTFEALRSAKSEGPNRIEVYSFV